MPKTIKKDPRGRKPEPDKKITLPIYPRTSRIEKIGRERAQEIAVEAIEREYEKRIQESL